MQNSLWKLGALLGVIGVGFLVLLKAQNEMTAPPQADESFNELAAIEELGDLDAATAENPRDDAGTTDHDSSAPSPTMSAAAENHFDIAPTPAIEPSVAASTGPPSSSTGGDEAEESINPFADFTAAPTAGAQTEPTPAGWETLPDADIAAATEQPTPPPTPASTDDELSAADQAPATQQPPSLADDTNPFGSLVESFSRPGEEGQDQQSQSSPAEASTPILPALADAGTLLPTEPAPTSDATPTLAVTAEQSPEQGAAELSTAAAAVAGAAASRMAAAAVEAFNPFPTDDPADETASEIPTELHAGNADAIAGETEAAPAGKPFEPTSLTALPPADGGPALMAPPDEAAGIETPSAVEPAAHTNEATADDASATDAGTQIAQLSGESSNAGQSDPQPFLVFPGTDEPGPSPDRQSEPAQPEPLSEAAAAEPIFPSGAAASTGRAWVGDTTRIEVPADVRGMPQREPAMQIEPNARADAPRDPDAGRRSSFTRSDGDERVVLPDGTVEMTIMPRNGEPQTTRLRQDQHAQINPFADGPQVPDSRAAVATGDARRMDAPPARQAVSQPQFPDPGLSLSRGPIQPSAAQLPETQSASADNALTSADFIGVGTISPDTPSTPQQAQLTIEKQAPTDAALGQDLIYSIVVKNIGRSEARNVVVEDLVPKGTELQGTDPQAHMTPDKKLVWKLGVLSPGASRTIRIKVIPRQAGQIGSVATVSFEAAVASRTVITAPQLQLALNGPQEVRLGEKVPYTFTMTNSGSADASNVYIRNIIPAGFEHPAAQQRNGVTDIEYEVGTLRRGESRDVELTLLAVAEGDFQNHAILSADGNVNVQAHREVRIISSRLKVHREGPANRVVGAQAQFTNTVTNQSSRPLQGVRVTETIPAGVKFVQASHGGDFNPQQRLVSWQLDTLEPGGVRQLQTVVLAEQAGQMDSTISATDRTGDQAEATSQLNVAGYSSLTIDVANPARAIPVGEEVALRLKVRNGGTAAARDVETRIKLPPELTFVSARGPVRYARQGEWIAFEPIDRIDIQDEQTFDIVLTAAAECPDARVVVHLSSEALSRPLSEDESVVIYAD